MSSISPVLLDAELLSQVHDTINATDAQGILHTWNAGAERIYGYTAGEVLGKHVSILLYPEDHEFLRREIFEPLVHKDFLETIVRNRRKDGAEIFVSLRLSVIRGRDGNVAHIVACSNDITERIRAENRLAREIAHGEIIRASLAASEQRLKHLLVSGPAVLYAYQPHGDLPTTFVSENMFTHFGHAPRQFLEDPRFWLDHVHLDDRVQAPFRVSEMLSRGRVSTEYRFQHADGSYRWVRDTAAVVRDAEGQPVEFLGHMLDITPEKQAEAEQQRHEQLKHFSQAVLAAQEAERKRVSRELHDDLNQRLATLILDVGLLERDHPDISARMASRLRSVKNGIAEISDDVRRIALQLHSAGLEQFGLSAALKSECAAIAERSGIRIVFRSRAVPREIPEDVSVCLYRVAQEGLRNVVRHSMAAEARVTLTGEPGRIRLEVKDCGAGFQPQDTQKRRTLGLTSMSERVRQAGGTFEIDARPGQGTRIIARVPINPGAET